LWGLFATRVRLIELSRVACLTPAERRLSERGESSFLLGATRARNVLASIPITAGDVVPVLVAQEYVGSVSQTTGALAGSLTALDPLSDEIDALPVL
jgi:hypothetical protein